VTVSVDLESQVVTGRYLLKHSTQDGLDKVLTAYGKHTKIYINVFFIIRVLTEKKVSDF
jgi:hypothetical protein